MFKRKLGVISACLSLCATANASISAGSQSFIYTPSGFEEWVGTDSDVVFYLHDTSGSSGTYFINLTNLHGVTIDALMSGENYSVELSHSSLNVTDFDTWGLAASSNDIGTTYEYGMVGVNLGTLFVSGSNPTGPTGGDESNANDEINFNTDWINQINSELNNADNGLVPSSSAADYSEEPYQNSQFSHDLIGIYDTASLYLYGILDPEPEPLWYGTYDTQTDFQLIQSDLRLQGNYLLIGPAATVPVPASAYFFITGIASLAACRARSKKKSQ